MISHTLPQALLYLQPLLIFAVNIVVGNQATRVVLSRSFPYIYKRSLRNS